MRLLLIALCFSGVLLGAERRPDILYIAVDDLNDWISPMGGNSQTVTPNFDRLAKQSVMFTNAHCIAPSCGPVRAAMMTGITPWNSGLYRNDQPLRSVMPDVTLMPRHFANNGYHAFGSGKILHYVIDPPSWDDYFPAKDGDDPFPFTLYPKKRPVTLPRGGMWQYVETDWGPLDCTDEEFGGDYSVTKWVAEQLANPPEKPFFLACGLYRPHEPWFVPKKYFEPFPLDEIKLPEGYREDDLKDVPERGQKIARNRYFEHIQKEGQWKSGLQGYLASIHFADAMLGRVLDALEKSPRRDNTIVVLWSDHGWHLGEKEHWQKFTGWRVCSRVPFFMMVPKGCPGLPQGTVPGVCDQPVSTFDTYRTLLSLTGVPDRKELPVEGRDLTPLLANPKADWPHVAITQLGNPNEYAVSAKRFRYIHYVDGSEELYDLEKDPHEFVNLAGDPAHADKLAEMRAHAPADPKPLVVPGGDIPELQDPPVMGLSRGEKPRSSKEGAAVPILVRNSKDAVVRLFRVEADGTRHDEGKIAVAKNRVLRTQAGMVWEVRLEKTGEDYGFFVVPDQAHKVLIE